MVDWNLIKEGLTSSGGNSSGRYDRSTGVSRRERERGYAANRNNQATYRVINQLESQVDQYQSDIDELGKKLGLNARQLRGYKTFSRKLLKSLEELIYVAREAADTWKDEREQTSKKIKNMKKIADKAASF